MVYEQDWHHRAKCRGRPPADRKYDWDFFFPAAVSDEAEVAKFCDGCPVKEECLTFALDNDQKVGVWGGLTANERASLVRRRKRGGTGAQKSA